MLKPGADAAIAPAAEAATAQPEPSAAAEARIPSGQAAAAIRQVGVEPVQRAIVESLAPFRTSEAGYRLCNSYRYVIAAV